MKPLAHATQDQPTGQVRPTTAARQSLTGLRLRKHADYQRAYAAGRKRQSASMSWFLAPQQREAPTATDRPVTGPRVGLTAGKVLGKAHERNRIKRRMREALRRHVALLPLGCDLILHPRRSVLTSILRNLKAEIVRILQQAKPKRRRMDDSSATGEFRSPGKTTLNRPVPESLHMTRLLLATLAFYRRWLSPALHRSTRALPLSAHVLGVCRSPLPRTARCAACALAFWRLLRCHPFGRGGLDNVPAQVPISLAAKRAQDHFSPRTVTIERAAA
jgi:ribonuclease P protein component